MLTSTRNKNDTQRNYNSTVFEPIPATESLFSHC
jgi:hypothetical protein